MIFFCLGESLLIPLILMTNAILASGSTKKFPAFLALLLASMSALSAAAYSPAYFSAFLAATILLAARSFLAASRAAFWAARSLASRAVFFWMFSGTTLALKHINR